MMKNFARAALFLIAVLMLAPAALSANLIQLRVHEDKIFQSESFLLVVTAQGRFAIDDLDTRPLIEKEFIIGNIDSNYNIDRNETYWRIPILSHIAGSREIPSMLIGNNVTTLVVKTSIGSRDILVKTTKQADRLPTLNALDVTDISSSSAVLHGQIIDAGEPQYTKRGFLCSELSSPTPENSITITAIISNDAEFSAGIDGLLLGKSYYVKAFAENRTGIAFSANTVKFTTISSAPIVETLEPSSIDTQNGTVILRGKVVYEGDPSYTEKGFVFSSIYSNPSIDDSKTVVSGQTGNGLFEKRVSLSGNLFDYYVRAYALSDYGIAYGEPVKVSPEGYLVLSSVNLQVEKNDVGVGNWSSMKTLCENRTTGNVTGWRLPTKDELATLYSLRNEIGGFTLSNEGESSSNTRPAHYWSATYAANLGYYFINFETGSLGNANDVASYKKSARCVRSINHD